MRRELLAGVHAGAALAAAAGCGNSADTPSAASQLEPLPTEFLGCQGPNHDGPGYYGQCCFRQRCYEPPPGEACAAGTPDGLRDSSAPRLLLPQGSGSCSCSVPEVPLESLEGPFAVNPEAITADPATGGGEGSCCYIVSSIACDGRPFVVSGTQRVAGVVRRDDWGPFA